MAYQSLYRRYRPQKFSEIKGQDHVVRALQAAVRNGTVGHAYLLHGPRGSGKTSTARVLAKALNCPELSDDGEPCCVCDSCQSIQHGRSFDLQELDAASNNKVDDMRNLLERVNLASPGQAKVYLLDEVHMLTAGAENALLKTLEEPPSHVTWVLATTEPHKVVQTIRSRCQVFELGLLDADLMVEHVRYVADDAELGIDDDGIDAAVAAGGGSVRDTLTALERIAAGGGSSRLDASTDAVLAALADRDRAAALTAVGDAMGTGRDPRTVAELALAGLRDAFLTAMGNPPSRMSEHERNRAADLAERMAPGAMTRALETLGRALIDMRQAPDPRVDIEVALMRLCQPDEDHSLEALAERLRRLEVRLDGSEVAEPAVPARQTAPPPVEAPQASRRPADAARAKLSQSRSAAAAQAQAPRVHPPQSSPPPVPPPELPPPLPAAPSAPAVPVQEPDLAAMRPSSPSEVVELAQRHLGLDRDIVVERAMSLEPDRDRRREPAQLDALWRDLIDRAAGARPPETGSAQAGLDSAAPVTDAGSAAPEHASPAAGGAAAVSAPEHASPVAGGAAAVSAPEHASPVAGGAAAVSAPEHASPVAGGAAAEPAVMAPSVSAEPEALQRPAGSAGFADRPDEEFDLADLHDLTEAPSHAEDIEQKIKEVFPGAELVLLPESDSEQR